MVVYAHMQGSSGFRLWNLKLVGCHRSGFGGFKALGLENSAKSRGMSYSYEQSYPRLVNSAWSRTFRMLLNALR